MLVVSVLLAADWLLDRRSRRDAVVFRGLAGVHIGLVLAITASALQRLRLYHASYGLTESRFYAMVLLIWIGAMLFWLAATVLRGRRDSFAFGTLASGLATVALLFVINPDAVIARANVARMASADAPVRFDVAYATSLSADAVPVLIEALSALPRDVQCPSVRSRDTCCGAGHRTAIARSAAGTGRRRGRVTRSASTRRGCGRWWGRMGNARRPVPDERRPRRVARYRFCRLSLQQSESQSSPGSVDGEPDRHSVIGHSKSKNERGFTIRTPWCSLISNR